MLPQSSSNALCQRIDLAPRDSPLTPYFTYSSRVTANNLQASPKCYLSIASFDEAVNAEDISFFLFRHHTKTLAGDSRIRCTRSSNPSGSPSPSRCNSPGFNRKSCGGSCIRGGCVTGLSRNPLRNKKTSARSSISLAESLKSSRAGSRTATYNDGFTNCISELLSTITFKPPTAEIFSASIRAWRSGAIPSAKNPCLVRSQNDRAAPAFRNLALSVSTVAFISQSSATMCSVGAQSQSCPFVAQTPWPYCVIFPAIHFADGSAAIRSHTNCVLPMLRVCPPTTINRHAADFCSVPAVRNVSGLGKLRLELTFQLFDAHAKLR